MLFFEIGGLPVVAEGEASLAALERHAAFVPFRTTAPSEGDSLRWRLDAAVEKPDVSPCFVMPVGLAECRVYAVGERVCCELGVDSGVRQAARIEYDPAGDVVRLTPMPAELLQFALWLAYNMQASARMCFGLHAAAVVKGDWSALFLGESGTGKSTHARLWCRTFPDCWLLNDDSPVVAFRDGALWAYGSPWSGKTPCYRTGCFPLRGLVRLSQASENRIVRLGPVKALAALIPSFPPMLVHTEPFRSRMFGMLEALLAQSPTAVCALDCLPDIAAARCCLSALE